MTKAHVLEAEQIATEAVGDVIRFWGFRKPLGRLWTILFLAEDPLSAADLSDRLHMSAGAVSMTVAELERWGVVRRVWRLGERKDYFEAETDFWKMISKVVSERERFLARSVRERLDAATQALEKGSMKHKRMKQLLGLASIAETVIDAFVESRKADFTPFQRVIELARVRG